MLNYCIVKQRIGAITEDTPDDDDRYPDYTSVFGQVVFAPTMANGSAYKITDDDDVVHTVPATRINAQIVNGEITHEGLPGLPLFAAGPNANPSTIVYTATYSNLTAAGRPVDLNSITFRAVPGETIDLSSYTPVAGAPTPGIIQGPPGHTPFIGQNGNWWINGKDTGVAATSPLVHSYTELAGAFEENTLRVKSLEAMNGVSPETPVDGQTANLIAQPTTLTRAAVDAVVTGLLDDVAANLTVVERGSMVDSSTSRPDWPGIVEWYIYDGDPIPENTAEGDLITVVGEWTPSAVPGLLAWWDVRAAETDGGDVLRVPDKSGNDYHMLSHSPLAQGTVAYSETAFNGTPGLVFDGGGTLATEDFPGIGTGPITIFANVERTSTNNPTTYFLGGHDSNTIGLYQVGANLEMALGARRGAATRDMATNLAPRSVAVVFDGSNSTLLFDDHVLPWVAQNTDTTALVMGGRYNETTGVASSQLVGNIGDIFVLRGAASSQLIDAGMKWLRQRAELGGV